VESGCSAELVALLLDNGADPRLPGPDGRSPSRRAEVAELLRGYGVQTRPQVS
jgi:hypothetical protein